MSNHSSPALSAVLITPDCYATIDLTMSHLLAQSVRDQLEIVIVAPSADSLEADQVALATFHSFQVVEVGELKAVGQAKAAGARRSRAPVVAFVEEHSYPHVGWAEALIEAHHQPWAAVGPAVDNANGDSLVGWADFLMAYGPWMDPSHGSARDSLPGHNSSYKRALLLEYGVDLERMLESEAVLHSDLRNRGQQLYLEPAAKISHLNFEQPSAWTRSQYYSGRAFAASRSEHWPEHRRLLYAVGGPLIPFARLSRILGQLRRSGSTAFPFPAVLPALLYGLAVSALGEIAGYVLGGGAAVQKLRDLQFHRVRHLNQTSGAPGPAMGPESTA